MLKKKDTIVMTFKSIYGYFSNIAQIVLSLLSKCYMDLANSNTPAGSGLGSSVLLMLASSGGRLGGIKLTGTEMG